MGIGEQFEFEKTGRIAPEPTVAVTAATEATLLHAKTFIGKPLNELTADMVKRGHQVRVARKNGENPLHWQEDFDNDNNSVWTADSCYTDDAGMFKWRLIPSLSGNQIVWRTANDDELGNADEQWASLEEAKAAIQRQHDEHIASEKQNQAVAHDD